ncbi:MAG: hypothetical protein ACM3O4_05770, partial [Ignavibacteriales bacterium]
EVYTSDNSNGIVTVERLGCNVEMGIPGDYKCQYKTTDESGNIAYNDRFIKVVDTTAPTFIVTGNPIDWTKEDVTLTVIASDNTNLFAALPYSFDGGNTWQVENTSTFTNNEDISIKVMDQAGNVSPIEIINITKIDKLPATITNVTGNPIDWTKEDVTLTVMANDDQSGLQINAYSFDNGNTWQSENTSVFNENTSVNIKVRDVAGNVTSWEVINITKIDKSAPVITVDPTTITVAYGDSYDNMQGVTAIDIGSGIFGEIISDYNPNMLNTIGTKLITYTVTDNVSNTSTATRNLIVVDAVAPTITLNSGSNIFTDFMEVNIGYGFNHWTKKFTVTDNYDLNIDVKITTRYETVQGEVPVCLSNDWKCFFPKYWSMKPVKFTYAIGTTYTGTDSSGNEDVKYYDFEIKRLVNTEDL